MHQHISARRHRQIQQYAEQSRSDRLPQQGRRPGTIAQGVRADSKLRVPRRPTGGATDAIQRIKTLLPDSSVAQSLAAFHGEPNLAYNETRSIWDNDAIYSRVFRQSVTARHIVFTYSLLKAVEQEKQTILAIREDSRTDAQKRHAAFFSSRGSNYLFVAAIGSCIETILDTAVADRYSLRFKKNLSPADAVDVWTPVVIVASAFSSHLMPATDRGLKAQERVKNAIEPSVRCWRRSAQPTLHHSTSSPTRSFRCLPSKRQPKQDDCIRQTLRSAGCKRALDFLRNANKRIWASRGY